MKKDISLIIERIESKRKRDKIYGSALIKVKIASELLEDVEHRFEGKKIKFPTSQYVITARQQFIITLVSIIEIILRDIFIDCLIIKGKEQFMNEKRVKDFKMNLPYWNEVQNYRIPIEELIASQYNFQNPTDINEAYSTLLGIDFFKEIIKFKAVWTMDNLGPIQLEPNFYDQLTSLFHLRHSITHDFSQKIKPSVKQIYEYYDLTTTVIIILEYFIHDKLINIEREIHYVDTINPDGSDEKIDFLNRQNYSELKRYKFFINKKREWEI